MKTYRRGIVIAAASAAFLAMTALLRMRGDYPIFVEEWSDVLHGQNPWQREVGGYPVNAYAPLFNVIALLKLVSALAPKLLFAGAYVAFAAWLVRVPSGLEPRASQSWWATIFLFLNPFVWIQIAHWGYFDVLVGVACVAAVHQQRRGNDGASGFALALGILLKLVPVVVLPFLVFGPRPPRWRLLAACVGLVALGFALSFCIWGSAIATPIAFLFRRESAGRSPFALAGMSVAGVAVFGWCVFRKTSAALSALLAILVVLVCDQIALERYHMISLCLLVYWALSEWKQIAEHRIAIAAVAAYVAWLAIEDVIFILMVRYPAFDSDVAYAKVEIAREVLTAALLACLLYYSSRAAKTLDATA
jgi:hypothetical protein